MKIVECFVRLMLLAFVTRTTSCWLLIPFDVTQPQTAAKFPAFFYASEDYAKKRADEVLLKFGKNFVSDKIIPRLNFGDQYSLTGTARKNYIATVANVHAKIEVVVPDMEMLMPFLYVPGKRAEIEAVIKDYRTVFASLLYALVNRDLDDKDSNPPPPDQLLMNYLYGVAKEEDLATSLKDPKTSVRMGFRNALRNAVDDYEKLFWNTIYLEYLSGMVNSLSGFNRSDENQYGLFTQNIKDQYAIKVADKFLMQGADRITNEFLTYCSGKNPKSAALQEFVSDWLKEHINGLFLGFDDVQFDSEASLYFQERSIKKSKLALSVQQIHIDATLNNINVMLNRQFMFTDKVEGEPDEKFYSNQIEMFIKVLLGLCDPDDKFLSEPRKFSCIQDFVRYALNQYIESLSVLNYNELFLISTQGKSLTKNYYIKDCSSFLDNDRHRPICSKPSELGSSFDTQVYLTTDPLESIDKGNSAAKLIFVKLLFKTVKELINDDASQQLFKSIFFSIFDRVRELRYRDANQIPYAVFGENALDLSKSATIQEHILRVVRTVFVREDAFNALMNELGNNDKMKAKAVIVHEKNEKDIEMLLDYMIEYDLFDPLLLYEFTKKSSNPNEKTLLDEVSRAMHMKVGIIPPSFIDPLQKAVDSYKNIITEKCFKQKQRRPYICQTMAKLGFKSEDGTWTNRRLLLTI